MSRTLIHDLRWPAAASLIPEIEAKLPAYLPAKLYRTWPGPTSTSFTAHTGCSKLAMGPDLPPPAIGKDSKNSFIGCSPGGGLEANQVRLFRLLISPAAGVEVGVLSLSVEVDPFQPSLRLRRIGLASPHE